MLSFMDRMPLHLLVFASLTLGLAPFYPEPHIWQKVQMLAAGTLVKPLDVFDFLMHGTPWVLLILKLLRGNRSAAA